MQWRDYVIYSCAFIIVQLVLLWTHGSIILRGGAALDWKAVLTNVNLLSIGAGAALYFLHIPLPGLLTDTMDSVGALMGPLAMLLAGTRKEEIAQAEADVRAARAKVKIQKQAFGRTGKAIIRKYVWRFFEEPQKIGLFRFTF